MNIKIVKKTIYLVKLYRIDRWHRIGCILCRTIEHMHKHHPYYQPLSNLFHHFPLL
ncbi:hypothetical protein MNB_SV-4-656 [hydrothermal vent metagenome]|uniref:Uncharacterized protein n=1 Tax=hydrothermal vent metagenome TaxID=652676 RepID=A0A1W1EA80_9ZZZZ